MNVDVFIQKLVDVVGTTNCNLHAKVGVNVARLFEGVCWIDLNIITIYRYIPRPIAGGQNRFIYIKPGNKSNKITVSLRIKS